MKKPTLISLSLLTAVSFSVALVSTTMSTNPLLLRAGEKTTTITLNSGKTPQITDGSGSLVYNEHASFTYTNASVNEGGHVSLADGGTIYKNEASKSLKLFTATFDGALILQTGYTGVADECYRYTLVSGNDTAVKGNYFKLISSGATNISEIVIVFGCEDEEAEGDHNYSSEWTHDATHHWHACEDDNCVRKDGIAEHTVVDIDMVAPTKETAGSYNGKQCSVCGRVLVEPTVLPILSATDYDISYRTAMIDGEVRDSETYTLKTDTSISFDVGYGDTVYTEYIHAGTSYYSLNRWNELFPDAIATYDENNEVLTITLSGDTTVTAESGGDLDGMLDLTLYPSVVITGEGELNIQYNQVIDGINCYDLTIDEGATVNLTGYNKDNKTAIKAYGTLQIDGILNIDHYCYAFALTNEVDVELAINVGASGQLNVTDSMWGIYSWNKPENHTASINIAGEANITTQKCPVYVSGASCPLYLTGSAVANFTSTAAVGIYSNSQIYVRDSASLNIDAAGGGIFNIRTLMVANGTEDNPQENSASLNVVCGGAKSTTSSNDPANGLSQDGNMIQSGTSGNTKMIFVTKGQVWVECTVTGKTGVQFTSSSNNQTHKLVIKTSNMTIKNANNAFGCWVAKSNSRTISTTYDYTSEGLSKITLINCSNIVNTGSDSTYGNKARFAPLLATDAVNRITE